MSKHKKTLNNIIQPDIFYKMFTSRSMFFSSSSLLLGEVCGQIGQLLLQQLLLAVLLPHGCRQLQAPHAVVQTLHHGANGVLQVGLLLPKKPGEKPTAPTKGMQHWCNTGLESFSGTVAFLLCSEGWVHLFGICADLAVGLGYCGCCVLAWKRRCELTTTKPTPLLLTCFGPEPLMATGGWVLSTLDAQQVLLHLRHLLHHHLPQIRLHVGARVLPRRCTLTVARLRNSLLFGGLQVLKSIFIPTK